MRDRPRLRQEKRKTKGGRPRSRIDLARVSDLPAMSPWKGEAGDVCSVLCACARGSEDRTRGWKQQI